MTIAGVLVVVHTFYSCLKLTFVDDLAYLGEKYTVWHYFLAHLSEKYTVWHYLFVFLVRKSRKRTQCQDFLYLLYRANFVNRPRFREAYVLYMNCSFCTLQ
jgi:hypothetical protein